MEAASRDSQSDALSEGRRIYLGACRPSAFPIYTELTPEFAGNLLYVVRPHEIGEILGANGFQDYEDIHISIDPVSGRNPGYCFVDFHDSATANRALFSLRATIRGRPVKVGPCEPKKPQSSGSRGAWRGEGNNQREPVFQRWGNWKPPSLEDGGVAIGKLDSSGTEQGPYLALDHFDDMVEHDVGGRRLYVGGLGKMISQPQAEKEMRELFAGFNP